MTGDAYRTQLESTVKANLRDSRVDQASHFILRAAYCRTEELRRWFLAQEVALLKHRLDYLDDGALQTCLRQFDLQKVSSSEKERLRECLLSLPGITPGEFMSTTYFAIPFAQALDLVAKRMCFVSNGLAYVPLSRVVSILSAKFRMRLSRSLVLAAAAFSRVEEESRIAPLLKTMNAQNTGQKTYSNEATGDYDLTAATVDSMTGNMPLCMSQLHTGLKRDHKLKHWGRLQYGLFLKGAGMSMEESLLFFQKEFSKIMTAEQFQKNYSYNVRHMYGKEGKRASYTPYNCKKVILGQAPQGGDHHGCPYRHYDEQHLASVLQKMNIGSAVDRGEILKLKRSNNFQLACLKHFEVMHPSAASHPDVDLDNVGNHPNAWFSASASYSAKSVKKEAVPSVSPEKPKP